MAAGNDAERTLLGADVAEVQHHLQAAEDRGVDVEAHRRGGLEVAAVEDIAAPVLARLVHHHRDRPQLGVADAGIVDGRLRQAAGADGRVGPLPEVGMIGLGDDLLAGLEADRLAGRPQLVQPKLDGLDQRRRRLMQGLQGARVQLPDAEALGRDLARDVGPHAAHPAERLIARAIGALDLRDDRFQLGFGLPAHPFGRLEHAAVGGVGGIIDPGQAKTGRSFDQACVIGWTHQNPRCRSRGTPASPLRRRLNLTRAGPDRPPAARPLGRLAERRLARPHGNAKLC